MTTSLLITLLPSTDVDLGRWLLQHFDTPYTERPHAPVFHVLALKSWGVGADDYPLWVLNGQKSWITNAGISKYYTVMAVTDPDKGANGIFSKPLIGLNNKLAPP